MYNDISDNIRTGILSYKVSLNIISNNVCMGNINLDYSITGLIKNIKDFKLVKYNA